MTITGLETTSTDHSQFKVSTKKKNIHYFTEPMELRT